MQSLIRLRPPFSITNFFTEDDPFFSMQPPSEETEDFSEESDEDSEFEAEGVSPSQNGDFEKEESEDDIHTPKPRRVAKKRRDSEPKKQTPPVREVDRLPKSNHKQRGSGRRGEKITMAAAAKVATGVKAGGASAATGVDLWITADTLSGKARAKKGCN